MVPSEKTLYDYFREIAQARGGDLFLFDENVQFSFDEAFRIAKGLAAQIESRGVTEKDVVYVKATRTVDAVLVFFAVQFVGAAAVMCDPRNEIEENIVVDGLILTVNGKVARLSLLPQGEPRVSADCKKPTIEIYTSGTTGISKSVRLSQYNFINNALDTRDIGGYRSDDVNILIVPIHHVFGLALLVIAVVTGHAVCVPRAVDTEYVLDCMEKYGVTRLNGVPGMYLSLAEKAGERKLRLNCGFIGGGPYTKEQFLSIEKRLGITLIPVYGMSECIGISCGSFEDGVNERCDGVGRIYSMNTVEIAADGEVLVKSPAASPESASADGWLHTGDLGYIDGAGYLHLYGRKKDIIIRNGNNLSTVGIEKKILSIPQVKDVCVVGTEDERQGEVPCALIVASADVTELLHTVLNKNEIPQSVLYADAVPLTSTGKPDKKAVKAMFSK